MGNRSANGDDGGDYDDGVVVVNDNVNDEHDNEYVRRADDGDRCADMS